MTGRVEKTAVFPVDRFTEPEFSSVIILLAQNRAKRMLMLFLGLGGDGFVEGWVQEDRMQASLCHVCCRPAG